MPLYNPVTGATIADDSITNADINSAAAIDYSKLATLATGKVVAGNAGVPTATTLGGDATVGATGTLTIAAGAVTDTKVAAANKDGTTGTASMRTLGTGSTQAAQGSAVELLTNKDTDTSLAANSDTKYASQKAAKAYTDAALTTAEAYADSVAQGLSIKGSVRLATAAALPANARVGNILTGSAFGALTVDGTAVAVADRILVKDEVAGANNGIYSVTATGGGAALFVLTRTTDANTSAKLAEGSFVFCEEGTANAGAGFVLTTANVDLNTTSLTFTQFSGAGEITAGDGMTKTGNTLDVVGGTGITVAANSVTLAAHATSHNAGGSDALAIDAAAATGSLRTLGTAATQAAKGSDAEYAFSTYKRLCERDGNFASAVAAGTYVFRGGANSGLLVGAASSGLAALYLEPADFGAVGTRTTYLRLRAFLLTNAVAPAANFTFGLYPIATWGGASGAYPVIASVGTVTSGSTVLFTAPGATSQNVGNSGDFAFPAAGWYALGVLTSAQTAANSQNFFGAHLDVRQT